MRRPAAACGCGAIRPRASRRGLNSPAHPPAPTGLPAKPRGGLGTPALEYLRWVAQVPPCASSAERWDDVLGEQLDLAHLLVPGHETLVEEPAEPFEIAVAAELIKRLDFGLDLIDRPGQRVFGFAEPLDGPFGLRQHRRRGIFRGVLRKAERLGEAEAAEVMVKH